MRHTRRPIKSLATALLLLLHLGCGGTPTDDTNHCIGAKCDDGAPLEELQAIRVDDVASCRIAANDDVDEFYKAAQITCRGSLSVAEPVPLQSVTVVVTSESDPTLHDEKTIARGDFGRDLALATVWKEKFPIRISITAHLKSAIDDAVRYSGTFSTTMRLTFAQIGAETALQLAAPFQLWPVRFVSGSTDLSFLYLHGDQTLGDTDGSTDGVRVETNAMRRSATELFTTLYLPVSTQAGATFDGFYQFDGDARFPVSISGPGYWYVAADGALRLASESEIRAFRALLNPESPTPNTPSQEQTDGVTPAPDTTTPSSDINGPTPDNESESPLPTGPTACSLECGTHQICLDGACKDSYYEGKSCLQDSDCAKIYQGNQYRQMLCDPKSYACVRTFEEGTFCHADSDCGVFYVNGQPKALLCHLETSRCTKSFSEGAYCKSNADCGSFYLNGQPKPLLCHHQTSLCTKSYSEGAYCQRTEDCGTYYVNGIGRPLSCDAATDSCQRQP
ncbi:MAG: hypothetical protein KC609_09950 [Myxococcales bacterium]|nr:hypothetical protein [Myxococcales bacterium]